MLQIQTCQSWTNPKKTYLETEEELQSKESIKKLRI